MLPSLVRRRQPRYSFAPPQDEELHNWVPSGLRQAERLYCVLFFVGWALVFGPFVTQALLELGGDKLVLKLFPEGLKGLKVSRSQCFWEVVTGLLQLLAHVAWYCTLLSSANRSSPSRWCSCVFSGFVIPLGILWFGLAGKKYLGLAETQHLQEPYFPWFGPLQRVLFYQVGWSWHVGLLLVQFLGEAIIMHSHLGWIELLKKFGINVFVPLILPPFIEIMFRPADARNPASHASKQVCGVEPDTAVEGVSQSQITGSSEGDVDDSTASLHRRNLSAQPGVEIRETHAQSTLVAPKNLALDVSEILRSPCGDKSYKNLLHYKSVVGLEARTIKVYNKNATDRKIQQYAEQYAANLSRKKMEVGKLTLVKGIGIRGCILFVAGMLDTSETEFKTFHDEAMELIDCLSYDLRLEDMDITIRGMTGRIVSGKVQSVKPVDSAVDVPEVALVLEPCAIQGQISSVEVHFTNTTEDWTSLSAVTVMDDAVSQKNLLCGSQAQNITVTIEGTSTHQNGHIRAVGVLSDNSEGPGSTFAGAMAPLLVLPKSAAYELNGLFTKTVIAVGPDNIESRKRIWQDCFRQFSLDMYYILEFTTEELSDLMTSNANMKQEYVKVLCNIIKFLYECDATQAIQYLLNLVDNTGVELVADGKNLADQLGIPLDKKWNKDVSENRAEAGPSVHTQNADEQWQTTKGKSTGSVASDVDTRGCMEFTWWKGFEDPALETQYRAHHKRRTATTDIVGTVMGLCLVPLMWQLVSQGKALYLSPVITQFFICNFWLVLFRRTYVHNRQPVMVLHWVVRLVAFVAQSTHEGWPSLSMPGIWSYLVALLIWTVVIKPRVMKMLLRDHIIFSLCDLVSWVGIVIVNILCDNAVSGLIPAILALSGTAFSCLTVFWAEQTDRKLFAVKFESQSVKLHSLKQ